MAQEILADYILSSLRSTEDAAATASAVAALAAAAGGLRLLGAAQLAGPHGGGVGEVTRRAAALAASKPAAAKRAGLAALAAVAADCDRATFLLGYTAWAGEAAAALKGAAHPGEVHRAAWQLLTAVFTRVGLLLVVPGVRREGAALVPRVAALLAQHAGRLGAPPPDALRACLAALTALPAPFKQHAKGLEPVLAGAMLGGGGEGPVARRLAAACLAALPRAGGDAEAWSAAAQRLLATAHALLDVAYLGLDDPALVARCRGGLDPGAAALPHPAPATAAASVAAYVAVFAQLDAVLACLRLMITRSFPSPVPLPTAALLLLVARVLGVDDARVAGRAAASRGKLAQLCLRLPAAHAGALRTLGALLRVAGAQAAPLHAAAGRLLGEHLGRAAAGGAGALGPATPGSRAALYAAASALLQAGGMGVTRQLAPAVLQCVDAEVYGRKLDGGGGGGGGGGEGAGGGPPAAAAAAGQSRKKAKRARVTSAEDAAAAELLAGGGNDDMGAAGAAGEAAAAAAALDLLEALLVGGATLLTPGDRHRADAVAAHAAATAAAAAVRLAQDADGDGAGVKGLQLAAYRALLASALAPAGHRPAHLPTALRLFRQGVRDQWGPLASFCSHVSRPPAPAPTNTARRAASVFFVFSGGGA
jgi:hypothetical protein